MGFLSLHRKARRARRDRRVADDQQRRRFAEHVAFAREHSPFYRDHYRGVRGDPHDSRALPVTSKRMLMERFDDWVTDREIKLQVIPYTEDKR